MFVKCLKKTMLQTAGRCLYFTSHQSDEAARRATGSWHAVSGRLLIYMYTVTCVKLRVLLQCIAANVLSHLLLGTGYCGVSALRMSSNTRSKNFDKRPHRCQKNFAPGSRPRSMDGVVILSSNAVLASETKQRKTNPKQCFVSDARTCETKH